MPNNVILVQIVSKCPTALYCRQHGDFVRHIVRFELKSLFDYEVRANFCQNNQHVTFQAIFALPMCNLQRWRPKDGCQLIKSSTYYNLSTDKIN
jgi:hypothetical protein